MPILNIKTVSQHVYRIGVVAVLGFTLAMTACTKSNSRDERSDYQGASDPQANTPPSPTSGTGTLAVPVGQELATSITAALVEGGLTQEQANVVSREVAASGALAVDTGASLWNLMTGTEQSPLEVSAPKVAGAFVSFLDAPNAGISEDLRLKAIGVIASATFKFAGGKPLDASLRPALLGSIAQSVVSKSQEASLSDRGVVDAIGLVADATFGGMEQAGITSDQFSKTAQVIGSKIGEGVGAAGLSDASIPAALGKAAEKASTALGRLTLPDPTAAIASTTEGFVTGLAASSQVSRDVKTSAMAEVPKGVSTAIPAWVRPDQLATAIDKVTTSTLTTFVAKMSPDATELATSLPAIAAGSVAGLAKSSVSADTLGPGQLATRPLQSLVEKLDSVVSDPNARLQMVQNTLAKSISALSNRSSSTFATDVAPQMVSKAFEIATTNRGKLNVSSTDDETKVTAFYDSMVRGAIDGVARLGAANQSTAATASTVILSKTMDAAVSSLNTMYSASNTSISSTLLETIPVRTAQAAGEKLAKVLPPDDLNATFAAATSQYLYNVQSVVATRATTVDTASLSQSITANALASFSGAWNGTKTDLQTAATALNNSLGTLGSRLDAKVVASVQSGSQAVVVAAVGGKSNLPACSGSTASPELVACTKVAGAPCPTAIANANGYRLTWNADAADEACFLFRELIVMASSLGASCSENSDYVYGVGCRPKAVASACDDKPGTRFVYGIGCQPTTFFCPVGQKLSVDKGCVEDTVVYTCPAGQRRTFSGTCEEVIPTCAAGFTYNATTKICVASSTTPQCPPGLTFQSGQGCVATTTVSAATCAAGFYNSATGCRPNGSCDAGFFWDPGAQVCRGASACMSPNIWNASTNSCTAPDALASKCSAGQIWNGSSCQGCADGTMWDATAKLCRVLGTCPAGTTFNPDTNNCLEIVRTCSDDKASPEAPSFDLVSGLVGGVQLSWSGTADGYLLVRKNTPDTPAITFTDGIMYNARSTVSSSATNTGQIVFRGPSSATSFTDFEATDSTRTYDYELTTVNFRCNGPVYASAPVRASVKPLAPAAVSGGGSVTYNPPTDLIVSPVPATTTFPTGMIQVNWAAAKATLSSDPNFSQPPNNYVVLRRDPNNVTPALPSADAATLATSPIGTVLADGWRFVYMGPNPFFSDGISHLQGYWYTVAAVYRTSSISGSTPSLSAFVAPKSNPVAQTGSTTPSFVSVQLGGPVGDGFLNQFERENLLTTPLLTNLVADPEATKAYALVNTTGTSNFDCSAVAAANYVASATVSAFDGAAFADGSKYRICVRLTKSNSVAYGTSPEFAVDLIPPTIRLGSSQTATISATTQIPISMTSSDGLLYQWGSSDPSKVFFDAPNSLNTKVSASASGTYSLFLMARDAALNPASTELTLIWSSATGTVGAASRVEIQGPGVIQAGQCAGPYILQLKDSSGNPVTTSSALAVSLTRADIVTPIPFGIANDPSCTVPVLSGTVTIPSNGSNVLFYVKAGAAAYTGKVIASATNLTSFEQPLSIVNVVLSGAATDGVISATEKSAAIQTPVVTLEFTLPVGMSITNSYALVNSFTSCNTSGLAWDVAVPTPSKFSGADGSYKVCVRMQYSAGGQFFVASPAISLATQTVQPISSLTLSGPSLTFAGRCLPYQVQLNANATTDTAVSLVATVQNGALTLFSDSMCSSALGGSPSVTIPMGSRSATIFAKSTPASYGSAAITASRSGLTSGTANLQIFDVFLSGPAADGTIIPADRTDTSDIISSNQAKAAGGSVIASFDIVSPSVACNSLGTWPMTTAPVANQFPTLSGAYKVCIQLTQGTAVAYGETPPISVQNETGTWSVYATSSATNAGNGTTVTLTASILGSSPPLSPSYSWTVISGPGSISWGNQSTSSTTVTVSSPGAYTFRATVNGTQTSDVTVTWNAPAQMPKFNLASGESFPTAECRPMTLLASWDQGQSPGGSTITVSLPPGNPAILYSNDSCSTGNRTVTLNLGPSSNNSVSTTFYVRSSTPGRFWMSAQDFGWQRSDFQVFIYDSSAIPSRTAIELPVSVASEEQCIRGFVTLTNDIGQPAAYSTNPSKSLTLVNSGSILTNDPSCPIGNGSPVFLPIPANSAAIPIYFKASGAGQYLLRAVDPSGATPLSSSPLYQSVGRTVVAGASHSCLLEPPGYVKCWGSNDQGQLGNGSSSPGQYQTTPVNIIGQDSPVPPVRQLALGDSHTCALFQDFSVRCWGSNTAQQLGSVNSSTSPATASVVNFGPRRPRFIVAGNEHNCAILDDSSIGCWGSSTSEQLGSGTFLDGSSPVKLVSGSYRSVATGSGSNHTCAINNLGKVQCWGSNGSGQLGIGNTTTPISNPTFIVSQTVGDSTPLLPSNYEAMKLAMGDVHTCLLYRTPETDPQVSCWGSNADGQLGLGGNVNSNILTPQLVDLGGEGFTSENLAAGSAHTCAQSMTGSVRCWGLNNNGQVGLGSGVSSHQYVPSTNITSQSMPTALFAGLSLGKWHSCAIASSSPSFVCWGYNANGELGNDTTANLSQPP